MEYIIVKDATLYAVCFCIL